MTKHPPFLPSMMCWCDRRYAAFSERLIAIAAVEGIFFRLLRLHLLAQEARSHAGKGLDDASMRVGFKTQ